MEGRYDIHYRQSEVHNSMVGPSPAELAFREPNRAPGVDPNRPVPRDQGPPQLVVFTRQARNIPPGAKVEPPRSKFMSKEEYKRLAFSTTPYYQPQRPWDPLVSLKDLSTGER